MAHVLYRKFWLALFLFAAQISFCQNQIVDSLEKLLPKLKEDTNKALTLNRLSENLLITNQPQKAMDFANQSIRISHSLHFTRVEASAYENRGYAYLWLGDTTQAEKDFLLALQMRKEIGDKKGIARTYISLKDL